jgi:surface polysaccharide O-acyltransferase-like enzyme
MNHMFQRYVAWNFIGRASHDQDGDWTWKGYFGIPFFLGLFGLYTHFRKDWKMATVFLITFVLMGYLITYYQNQQQPQPRDREYFYCGESCTTFFNEAGVHWSTCTQYHIRSSKNAAS